MEIKISFTVTGSCLQTVQLLKDCSLTPEEVEKGLNGDKVQGLTLLTTVQDGGTVVGINSKGDSITLGNIINSDVNAEYEDFEAYIED